jgi:hypothetical protein
VGQDKREVAAKLVCLASHFFQIHSACHSGSRRHPAFKLCHRTLVPTEWAVLFVLVASIDPCRFQIPAGLPNSLDRGSVPWAKAQTLTRVVKLVAGGGLLTM